MRFFIVNKRQKKSFINLKNIQMVVYHGKYKKMNTKQKRNCENIQALY